MRSLASTTEAGQRRSCFAAKVGMGMELGAKSRSGAWFQKIDLELGLWFLKKI